MNPHTYRIYGLRVHSSIALDDLVEVTDAIGEDEEPDVIIRLGEVEPLPGEEDTTTSLSYATAAEVRFYYRDIARYLVRSGSEIIAQPAPGTSARILQIFILGVCFGTLLHQRGLLVLHASSVAVHGHPVVFMGHSSWGKSAMAAALHIRGHPIVADDIVAVHMQHGQYPQILPSFPRLKLWPDAVSTILQVDPDGLPQLLPAQGKKLLYGPETPAPQMCPLPTALFVLKKAEQVHIEAVAPQAGFVELLRFSYLANLVERTHTSQQHFHQCTYVAQHLPIFRLHRPQNLSLLSDIAELVEQHVHMLEPAHMHRHNGAPCPLLVQKVLEIEG